MLCKGLGCLQPPIAASFPLPSGRQCISSARNCVTILSVAMAILSPSKALLLFGVRDRLRPHPLKGKGTERVSGRVW